MRKPNSVIRIPCSLSKDFFVLWYKFLKPFHGLTEREIQVAALFTKYRFELSKVISDESILNSVLMNEDTRKKIREEANLSLAFFQVILGKLKKSNVIIDGKLNPKFIPAIQEENGEFILTFLFDFHDK